MSHTAFTKEAFRAFRDDDRAGPVHMLNLIKLRPRADYGDVPPETGAEAMPRTGAEAYTAYGRASAPVLARLGARIVWRGRLEQVLIGPGEEHWDVYFIAEYPSPGAFAEMVFDPGYREAMRHRQAAVADSRLIRLAPLTTGAAFNDPDD